MFTRFFYLYGLNITGYEITGDDWTDKVEKTATQLSHSYTGLTNDTEYTFKIRALNAKGKGAESTVKATPTDPLTHDAGVVINGITWATRNVDEPGKFAARPEDAGMYYQWNSKIPFSFLPQVILKPMLPLKTLMYGVVAGAVLPMEQIMYFALVLMR